MKPRSNGWRKDLKAQIRRDKIRAKTCMHDWRYKTEKDPEDWPDRRCRLCGTNETLGAV